jgi:hypothetical protein
MIILSEEKKRTISPWIDLMRAQDLLKRPNRFVQSLSPTLGGFLLRFQDGFSKVFCFGTIYLNPQIPKGFH